MITCSYSWHGVSVKLFLCICFYLNKVFCSMAKLTKSYTKGMIYTTHTNTSDCQRIWSIQHTSISLTAKGYDLHNTHPYLWLPKDMIYTHTSIPLTAKGYDLHNTHPYLWLPKDMIYTTHILTSDCQMDRQDALDQVLAPPSPQYSSSIAQTLPGHLPPWK